MEARSALPSAVEATHRRELYFFTLYRLLQASLLVLVTLGPGRALVDLHHPTLASVLSVVYLVAAFAFFLVGRRPGLSLGPQVGAALALDIVVALLAKQAIGGIEGGVSLLLLVNIGAASVILSLRGALTFAIAAAAGTLGEFVYSQFTPWGNERGIAPEVMYAVTYLATAVLTHLLGRQMRESAALAEQRGQELANLSQLNELIIRRMRTGVLVVDGDGGVRLMNEAAWMLMGEPSPGERALAKLAPELFERWRHWRFDPQPDAAPMRLANDRPEVTPRFARLTLGQDLFLIFLDDSALVSRRAEELTLSTLGRLSASIAHEIRNPLAAIHHAGQLLQESEDLRGDDRRLVEIVVNHCLRMNDIVENVLALSRRERSRPEQIDAALWAIRFVEEFRTGHFLESDSLAAEAADEPLPALVDPQQLDQVVSALVQNARTYGRLPGQPAEIRVRARRLAAHGAPVVEVVDRGPGLGVGTAEHLFEPFFTTSEYGTGLGLYIARQLCEANQATLEHHAEPGGGCCFRITLAPARALGADSPSAAAWQPAR